MADENTPEIILYDLASTKGVCFSPSVWRTRLILNYKEIPYKTIFLEFPDIEPTLKELGLQPAESGPKYTVPAIHHIPSNTHIMDSGTISEFLETTYPTKQVILKSDLGSKIEHDVRSSAGIAFMYSITPRERDILSPRSAEYFQRTREEALNRKLDDMLKADEDPSWASIHGALTAVSYLILSNGTGGPFILGKTPSYTDFTLAGIMQCSRVVHERVWWRLMRYTGFARVYQACVPFIMEKRD